MTEIVQAPAPWVERMQTANRMLAEIADDPFRASRVWDLAEAARVYAIQVGLGVEAVNHAVAVKLKAQRLLAEAVDKGQAEGQIATRGANQHRASSGPEDARPTPLPEVIGRESGSAHRIVSEARKIRDAFTDDDIDTAAADATLNGEELTSAQMLARAREVATTKQPGTHEPQPSLLATGSRYHAELRSHLLALDPERLAQYIGPDAWETWEATSRDVAQWFAALKAARPERLRAV